MADTNEEIIESLTVAIQRMDNSDAAWACVDAMKAARDRLASYPDLLATLGTVSKRASQLFEGREKLRADDARAVRRLADLADEAIAKATSQ